MTGFWEERYREEGKIWGDMPSVTTGDAIRLFRSAGVHQVLVPGSGYGRNAEAFARAGFSVTGIELSETAVCIARHASSAIRYHHGSVLAMPFDDTVYDSIYCFNVLHLLLAPERQHFVRRCREQLTEGGLIFFVVFSEKEESFGRGRELEPFTFESKPGRAVHYFTEEDLLRTFAGMKILGTGLVEEPEDHGDEGHHTHLLRYVCAQEGPHAPAGTGRQPESGLPG